MTKVVKSDQTKNGLSQAVVTGVVLAVTTIPAFAAVPEAPDVSDVVTYIGYAVGAVVAVGSAKMLPAAAMWLYSSLVGMVRRG